MHTINNVDAEITHTRPLIPDVPFYPGLTYMPPKPIRSDVPLNQQSSQNSSSVKNTNQIVI